MNLRTKIAAGIGIVALAAAGTGIAVAVTSGSSTPRAVQVLTPTGATETTVADTTTTVAPATTTSPPLTVVVPPATTTTLPSSTTSTTTDMVTVPNLVGDTMINHGDGTWGGTAPAAVSAAGLQLGPVTGQGGAGGSPPQGCFVTGARVTSQAPTAGQQVLPGTSVLVNC